MNDEKELEMPEKIDASPEEIAQRVLRQPPKKKWRYLEDNQESRDCDGTGRNGGHS